MDLDTVQQLLDHGADVNIRDDEGQTPFHGTLKDDQLDIVRYFLAHGTEVDILNGERKTPLAVASGDGQVETTRYLIDQGANVHASDDAAGPLCFGHHAMDVPTPCGCCLTMARTSIRRKSISGLRCISRRGMGISKLRSC